MSGNKKALILFLLVAVSATISLACGGSSGSGTAASGTPSASPSPSTSPSPTPTPSPSPTPTPNYSIGDFEGSWHFQPEGKIDMDAAFELWFNVLSDGSVEPEPDDIWSPYLTGGSLTLQDAETGRFSCELQFNTGTTVSFSGTLNADRDTMNVHFNEWNADGAIDMVSVREPRVGRYLFKLSQGLRPEDTNYFFYGVSVIDLHADGSYDELDVEGENEGAGTWSVFRNEIVEARADWDEDDDGEAETHLVAHVSILFDYHVATGSYRVTSPNGATDGIMSGFFSPDDLPQGDISVFGGTWNIVFQDDADSVPEGALGLLINDDGTIPGQSVGDVQIDGSITAFDGTSGAFTMSLTVQDEDGTLEHTYKGFISPFGDHIYAVEYTLVNGELEETGETRMFRAGAFDGPDLDGYWTIGTSPALGSATTMKVFNLRAQDGYLYLDSSMNDDPVGVLFLTDHDQVSFFLDIEAGSDNDIVFFTYGSLNGLTFTDSAAVLTDDEEGTEYYRGYLGPFDPSETADGNLTNYSGMYHLFGGSRMITVIAVTVETETRLQMEINGLTFDVVWDDRNLLLFHLHNDTLGDYANGGRFFFIPDSSAMEIGEWGFADPDGEWANLPADE